MFIKPAPGVRVLDPVTKKPLREQGKEVSASSKHVSYWTRRVAAGEVVVVQANQIPDFEVSP